MNTCVVSSVCTFGTAKSISPAATGSIGNNNWGVSRGFVPRRACHGGEASHCRSQCTKAILKPNYHAQTTSLSYDSRTWLLVSLHVRPSDRGVISVESPRRRVTKGHKRQTSTLNWFLH